MMVRRQFGLFAAFLLSLPIFPKGAVEPSMPAAWSCAAAVIGPGQFVRIEPGTFLMGSEGGEIDERPVHEVTITRAFYLQKTEVTQAQWQKVMGNNPSHFSDCGDACPVEQVSWDDVQVFLERLNEMDPGKEYRLPTEAEWEYAARAGTTGDYGGTGNLEEMGWHSGNANRRTHPVGGKRPNEWGLFDMHGNVWEWAQDWWKLEYYAESQPRDPEGPSTGQFRVLRGGSWNNTAGHARSTHRNGAQPSVRLFSYGFRLARNR